MTRGPFLVDTGFLVALVNRADPAHQVCAEVWGRVAGPFISTEGVLVESAWLLRKAPGALEAVVGLLRGVGAVVPPVTSARVDRALALMKRYRDVPMDLVDALLMALAEETNTKQVLSLDRRGFRTYRTVRGTALRMFPQA